MESRDGTPHWLHFMALMASQRLAVIVDFPHFQDCKTDKCPCSLSVFLSFCIFLYFRSHFVSVGKLRYSNAYILHELYAVKNAFIGKLSPWDCDIDKLFFLSLALFILWLQERLKASLIKKSA